MLSSGAAALQSPACLRCQLRGVLQHIRSFPAPHRRSHTPHHRFSTIHSRQAIRDGRSPPLAKEKNGVYYKHIGRIVGKAGRKQRQTSEALATDSLGEKSEIVIFRDVIESRSKDTAKANTFDTKESHDVDFGEQGLKGLSLTAEQIQAAISATAQAPDEQDVHASIDALRPQAPVLEKHEFDRLVKELLDCYNVRQLSRYLSRSLGSNQTSLTVVRQLEYSLKGTLIKPKGTRTISFTRSRWQPGRTPLETRRISEMPAPRGTSSSPKARAAERIVRVAWETTMRSEERQMGELEIQMPPWALALFFDLHHSGKPKYQALIEPQMLLGSADVRPYRPDNIIRITARRKDAEDIASQLENKVLLMGKNQLYLAPLLPQEGDKKTSNEEILQHFRQDDLQVISQKTQSVFIPQADGKIGIYAFKRSDRLEARRLLLSLLGMSSRNAKRVLVDPSRDEKTSSNATPLALVPVFPGRGVHFRDRSKSFARATLPVQKNSGPARKSGAATTTTLSDIQDQAENMSQHIASRIKQLDARQWGPSLESQESTSPRSFWSGRPFSASSTWRVRLGLVLQESLPGVAPNLFQRRGIVNRPMVSNERPPSTASLFLRQIPGYETMLSYFSPNERTQGQGPPDSDNVARKSTIVAHFTPSPFTTRGATALDLFPRFELTLQRRYGGGNQSEELKVESLCAISEEHIIDIPLPDKAVDICLSREVSSFAFLPAVMNDNSIDKFVRVLNESVQSGGSLVGQQETTFVLPGWMAESAVDTRKEQLGSLPEIEVPYLFDHFEQVQRTGFFKNVEALNERARHSVAIKSFNDHFPLGARLQYKEIEAGEIGGANTDIAFKLDKSVTEPAEAAKAAGADALAHDGAALSRVLTPALALADFVTRIARGEIKPWRGISSRPRQGIMRPNTDGVVSKEQSTEAKADKIEGAEVLHEAKAADV